MTATNSEKTILILIKIFSLFLILAGMGLILSPLIFVFKPALINEGRPIRPELFTQDLISIAVMHTLAGGYLLLIGVGYWRKRIWGPMCGIFLFVLALLLGGKGFDEALPTAVRAAYLGGRVALLPILLPAVHCLETFL